MNQKTRGMIMSPKAGAVELEMQALGSADATRRELLHQDMHKASTAVRPCV